MSNVLDIRSGLQQVLAAAIPDFPVFSYVTDSAPPPCAWIEPDTINYRVTMGTDVGEYMIILTVLTGRVNEQGAQDQLDKLVSPDGAWSIPAAVETNPTLGGVVEHCVPVSMDRYGVFSMEALSYIGAQITFEVRI